MIFKGLLALVIAFYGILIAYRVEILMGIKTKSNYHYNTARSNITVCLEQRNVKYCAQVFLVQYTDIMTPTVPFLAVSSICA